MYEGKMPSLRFALVWVWWCFLFVVFVRGQDALAPVCSGLLGEVFDGGGVERGALLGVDVPGAVVEW